MDIKVLRETFKSNGKVLKDKSRHEVSIEKFGLICYGLGFIIQKEDLIEQYDMVVRMLDNAGFDLIGSIRESLIKEEVFKGFKARGCKGTNSIIYYSENGERSFCLGASRDLDTSALYQTMVGDSLYFPVIERWQKQLSPHAEALKISINDTRKIIELIWEKIFTGPMDMQQDEIDFSMPPAILEGFGKGTEYTIPFKLKHSTLRELHPILKDFLERMEDHEYFCAILASRLIGQFKHYIPWLYGKGGEGKSTFMRFLDHLCPKGSAELNLQDKNTGLWEALGKTFLIIPDTNNKNIFHYEEVKKISGGDSVVINGKYKHPRTEKLPGMIIVSSNKLPNIGSYTYAQRRARIFKIKTGNFSGTQKELSVDKAAKDMMSTANEFLNYCLQCLKQVGNVETGQVPEPPSTITNSSKSLEEYEFLDFIDDSGLILSEESFISGKELRSLLKKESKNRSEFFKENFIEYLQNYCKVVLDKEVYKGIGKKNQKIIDKLDKELQEAMPK
jgi:hypothetical protein